MHGAAAMRDALEASFVLGNIIILSSRSRIESDHDALTCSKQQAFVSWYDVCVVLVYLTNRNAADPSVQLRTVGGQLVA